MRTFECHLAILVQCVCSCYLCLCQRFLVFQPMEVLDFTLCVHAGHYFCPKAGSVNHLYGHIWAIGGIFTIRLDDYISVGGLWQN